MGRNRANIPFEERVNKFYEQYQRLAQYRKRLDADPPTITLDDLRAMAQARAIKETADEALIASREAVDIDADLESDAEYRQERLTEYERVYEDWDSAGDQALLFALVELETQGRAIKRDLTRATTMSDKERLWKSLRENAEAQRNLQKDMGIDKKSRDQARITGNPMDNWSDIKSEIGDWVDMLISEFKEEADKAKTEEDLRDLMKIKLSWPFEVVDSVVYNLKRVNGIKQEDKDIG